MLSHIKTIIARQSFGRHLRGSVSGTLKQTGPTEYTATAFGGAITVTGKSQHEAMSKLQEAQNIYMTATPQKQAGSLLNRDGSKPILR